MDFSDQYFTALKERYFNHLVVNHNKALENSRDKDFTNEILTMGFLYLETLKKDEFSNELINTFDFDYKLGTKITGIIDKIPSIRERHVKLKEKHDEELEDQEIKLDYYKFLYVFKTRFIKQKTVLDHTGKIIEQINYKYDFSVKNLKKLKSAKTEQEKADIFSNKIRKQDYVIMNTIEAGIHSIVDINTVDKQKYFKFFVHYLTHKEFTEFLKQRFDQKKDEVESLIIDQIKNEPLLLNEDVSTKEFSTAFQVLAMHYIFEELQVSNDKKSRNISAKTRLIKMLTGKNEDKIKSIIDSPLDYKDLKGQKEDLKKLTKYFEDLKLDSIVEKINKDFVSASSKKDKDL